MIDHGETVEFTDEELEAAKNVAETFINECLRQVNQMGDDPMIKVTILCTLILGASSFLAIEGEPKNLPVVKSLHTALKVIEQTGDSILHRGNVKLVGVTGDQVVALAKIKSDLAEGLITEGEAMEAIQELMPHEDIDNTNLKDLMAIGREPTIKQTVH
jgi:hypothetical protein